MSKSYRKTPVFSNAGGSDKISKRWANRAYRNAVRRSIKSTADIEDCPDGIHADSTIVPVMNEVHNPATFRKDGKHYWHDANDKDMQK